MLCWRSRRAKRPSPPNCRTQKEMENLYLMCSEMKENLFIDVLEVEGEGAKSVKALDISEFSGEIAEFSGEGTELQSPSGSVCTVGKGYLPNVAAGNVLELQRNVEENRLLHGNVQSRRRRPPCYGWISEDEDEVDHALMPSTFESQTLVQCSHSGNRDRKRKSRWDV